MTGIGFMAERYHVSPLSSNGMPNDDSVDSWCAAGSLRLFSRGWRAGSGDLPRQRSGKLHRFWVLVRAGYPRPIAYENQKGLTGLLQQIAINAECAVENAEDAIAPESLIT